VVSEIRLALRALRKNTTFAAATIVTLALAIGVSAAMFSVIDAVLLRPLPYKEPEQLTMLWIDDGQTLREGRSAYGNIDEWRRQSRSFFPGHAL